MSTAMLRLLPLLFLLPALFAQRTQQCEAMQQYKVPGLALEITSTAYKAAALERGIQLPAYCRVDGILDSRTGVAGKPYGIRFALALPDAWNNSFLMQGGGGLNGSVQPPMGGVAAGGNPALARGFAVVSTDTGHQGAVFDGSFMADQQAALDFAYIAIGRVATLAKQMITHYYGQAAKHSYFSGCSTGGREAMIMTQRYPSYFDGVISGAPAMRTGFSNLADRYVATLLNQVAPKDAAGKPITAAALSPANKKLFMDSLLAACDAKDGIRDGMIWNTKACDFDPASLVCSGDPKEGCLTAAQADAIKRGFAGPKTARGDAVYSGFLYDTGITANGPGQIPGLLNPGPSPVGPPNTETQIDVDAMAAGISADSQVRLTDSTWINLSTFSAHGGSDPWFSALDTLGYYEKMTQANGGPTKVQEWSRFYMLPGMGHCGGGQAALDSFDLLSAMVRWVESGTEPDSVIATGKAFPGRGRPLCAYPKYAHYKGQGDPEKAENYECRQ